MGKYVLKEVPEPPPNERAIDLEEIKTRGTLLGSVYDELREAAATGYYGYAVRTVGKGDENGVLIFIPGAKDLGEFLTKEDK